ncbi:cytidylyltransferase domain-containing protein [Alkalilimnicola sp. S0819]|uniref:acylneuraminate cytidylyltransferase family protein n=1 Tax=Alkalilimnicola sp. S0819 TaxID=2613922 RepID=UPI001261E044|nr:acylneuraminate cytidylyltransferase family protein [Alkalilimnicola sp. S0819]KAB7628237.1 acylneuraminate cytidylyltransferase family protein [Alkalilimnicola sp. S0819]MPQ15128.1 NTP transferase domain-containing protein [Alkalilimnicola sp. S0819]
MSRKRIAIILARGGSKRLPGKNIMEFAGKPMLAWSVEAALDSGVFDRVLVSTDDEAIADVGRRYGAEVPFLRERANDDHSPTSLATHAALLQAEAYWGCRYDVVAQLMANCPLRNAEDIRAGMTAFEQATAPSQISCFRFGWMNPWWAVKLADSGRPEQLFPEALKARSQDLEALYCPTGALWLAERDAFLENKTFYMDDHRFEPLHWISAVDIDDRDDLLMAQACAALRQQQ